MTVKKSSFYHFTLLLTVKPLKAANKTNIEPILLEGPYTCHEMLIWISALYNYATFMQLQYSHDSYATTVKEESSLNHFTLVIRAKPHCWQHMVAELIL